MEADEQFPHSEQRLVVHLREVAEDLRLPILEVGEPFPHLHAAGVVALDDRVDRQRSEFVHLIGELPDPAECRRLDTQLLRLGLQHGLGDVLGVVRDQLQVLRDRPVADQREPGLQPDRSREVGVLERGEDQPQEEHEDLVRLPFAVERPLCQIRVAVGQRLGRLPAHRRAGRLQPPEQVVEGEVLRVDGTPDGDTLGCLLDHTQPHQLPFRPVDGVDVVGVQRPAVRLDVDHPPAEHVLCQNRPFERVCVEVVRPQRRLRVLGGRRLRQHGQCPLPTHPE